MKQHNRIQKSLSMIFSLALILLLAVPSQVLAQEETPQPEPGGRLRKHRRLKLLLRHLLKHQRPNYRLMPLLRKRRLPKNL